MAQEFTKNPGYAFNTPTFITQTPDPHLINEQALSALSTGYMKVTTISGVVSSQPVPIPIADGGTNNTAAPSSNGVLFFDGTKITSTSAGTNNTVLHGNTGSAPTFSAVSLTVDVTGVLPIANGGTNNSVAYTQGSVIFSDGTKLTQNNANLFWDDSGLNLLIGGATVGTADIVLGADGHAIFNQNSAAVSTIVKGTASTALLEVNVVANEVGIGTNTTQDIARFASTTIVFNKNQRVQDFQVSTDTQANTLFVKGSTDRVGIRTASPAATLHVVGGLSLLTEIQTSGATTTLNGDEFNIVAPPAAAATNTVNLPAASTAGRIYFIKKTTATGTLNIVPAGADTIDGVGGTLALTLVSAARTLMSDGGTNWLVIATV